MKKHFYKSYFMFVTKLAKLNFIGIRGYKICFENHFKNGIMLYASVIYRF